MDGYSFRSVLAGLFYSKTSGQRRLGHKLSNTFRRLHNPQGNLAMDRSQTKRQTGRIVRLCLVDIAVGNVHQT